MKSDPVALKQQVVSRHLLDTPFWITESRTVDTKEKCTHRQITYSRDIYNNNKEILVYIDDVFIHANTLAEHDKRVRQFFSSLAQTNLILQPDKVHFLWKEVAFLGHIVSERGVETGPGKVKTVKEFPHPKGVQNKREFLGLTGFYRRLLKDS